MLKILDFDIEGACHIIVNPYFFQLGENIIMFSGKLIKTKQERDAKYIFTCGGQRLGEGEIPCCMPKKSLYFTDCSGEEYELQFMPANEFKQIVTEFDHGNMAYEIIKQGQRVGYICSQKRGSFFNNYLFDQIEVEDKQYNVYFAALGQQGKRLMFYRTDGGSETQVAEVWKSNEVINRLDEYFYQAINREDILPLGLFLLYFDFRRSRKYIGERVSGSKEVTVSATTDKRLLEKYDPNFWEDSSF